MNLTKLFFIMLLAFAIGACGGVATEQKKDAGKDATKTEKKDEKKADEKKDEKKPTESGKVADSPKAAIENFVEAVKAKDESTMRGSLSEGTLKVFDAMAKQRKKSFYEVMTEKDKDKMEKMPSIKNEKIEGDKATAELKAPSESTWTKVNFVKENGSWKLSLFTNEEADQMLKSLEGLNELDKK